MPLKPKCRKEILARGAMHVWYEYCQLPLGHDGECRSNVSFEEMVRLGVAQFDIKKEVEARKEQIYEVRRRYEAKIEELENEILNLIQRGTPGRCTYPMKQYIGCLGEEECHGSHTFWLPCSLTAQHRGSCRSSTYGATFRKFKPTPYSEAKDFELRTKRIRDFQRGYQDYLAEKKREELRAKGIDVDDWW